MIIKKAPRSVRDRKYTQDQKPTEKVMLTGLDTDDDNEPPVESGRS